MINVKIICNSGDSFVKEFNGTIEDAKKYFIDAKFTTELSCGREIVDFCTNVMEAS